MKLKSADYATLDYETVHDIVLGIFAHELEKDKNPFDLTNASTRKLVELAYMAHHKSNQEHNPYEADKDIYKSQAWDALHTKTPMAFIR